MGQGIIRQGVKSTRVVLHFCLHIAEEKFLLSVLFDFQASIEGYEQNSNLDWINTLFQKYRDDLESLVAKGKKKRINYYKELYRG